jgi:uncharacterized membrane protein
MNKVNLTKDMDMKTVIAILGALAFLSVLGCESPRGGGVTSDEGFKIVTPAFDTKIKQGDVASVTVSLNRGEAFKRDVTLEIKAAPGIIVEPVRALVKGSDKPDVVLRITVPKDANLGEYIVSVQGTPATGAATSTVFKVMVVLP